MGENAYLCTLKNTEMTTRKTLFILLCLTAWLPTEAQHPLTFRGDTVHWIKIAEDNSYMDWDPNPDRREMVYPPEAWIEYLPLWNKQQLLKRNSRRTKTTEIDITAWVHLDSLMAEIGMCRLATAADLGITERMLKKTLRSRAAKKRFKYLEMDCIREFNTLEEFDRWLARQYEENKDTNCCSYMTHNFGFINVEIGINYKKTTNVCIWRYYPAMPYQLNGLNHYNLNIYRHLCALMPKTFNFSYEDFQKNLIMVFFEYLVENCYELEFKKTE